jgi:hypothetical protein
MTHEWPTESRLALATLVLDPGIGVLHNDLRGRDSLAADLMAPVRAKVDTLLLNLLTSEQLRREWVFEQRDSNCRLMASFASTLSETAPMCGRRSPATRSGLRNLSGTRDLDQYEVTHPATRLTE